MPSSSPAAALDSRQPEGRSATDSADARRLGVEEALFAPFYAETAPRLRSYLARITGNPAVADDLTQETFLRFLTRPQNSGDAHRWRSYVFQIATNLTRDRWRWEKREAGFLDRLVRPGGGPKSPEERLGVRLDFALAFSRLSVRDRALLWLAYVEGYEHAEIATVLGLRATSVRVLLFRLRRRAANLLCDLEITQGAAP